jgi:hypothetical protein
MEAAPWASETAAAVRSTQAIYGTIIATAVVAGTSEDESVGAGDLLLAVVGTAVVFWLAHLYCETLAMRRDGRASSVTEGLRWAMRTQRPILGAAVGPSFFLLLAIAGVVSRDAAVDLAIGFAIVQLFAWGFAAARMQPGSSFGGWVLGGSLDAFLGLLIVIIKTLVH